MSEILSVKWTILPQEPPRPLLYCKRCGGTRSYRSSYKIRVNTNGKRVDAWLIYRCTSCDGTWNRPVLERRPVRSIDPLLLASLLANDPQLAHRLAINAGDLGCWAPRLEEATQAVLISEVLSGSTAQPRELKIFCIVPHPLNLRLDRLLAGEMRLSRSRIRRLQASGALVTFPAGPDVFRRSVRDGTRIRIRLPIPDADGTADWQPEPLLDQ
jgi:hypothetical protein